MSNAKSGSDAGCLSDLSNRWAGYIESSELVALTSPSLHMLRGRQLAFLYGVPIKMTFSLRCGL